MKPVSALLFAVAVSSIAACGGDDPTPPVGREAVVRVQSAEPQPAIASICIGTTCQAFSETEDARSAEFSLLIDTRSPVEVLLIGEEPGFGTTSDIGPGDCLTVSYDEDGMVVDAGCGAETG